MVFSLTNESFCQATKDYQIETVAFYNVENLFDTVDDTLTFDDDRTALGKDRWTEDRYRKKLENIAKVLSEIGVDQTGDSPLIIGLCEIENRLVLEDLTTHPYLKEKKYGIIHFDSPDERGIDVALLYRKAGFIPLNAQPRKLLIYEQDKRDYTRDQLVVTGLLRGEEVHFIINHWPSRSGGEAKSSYKREKAALLNKKIIDSLYKENPAARIIGMGDFNDDPTNKSFKKFLQTKGSIGEVGDKELFNPMEIMLKNGKGTLAYRDSWNLFDQIYVSQSLISKDFNGFQFYKAGIFNPPYVITQNGQFKGYPYRTYGSAGYEPGYSDHFAVYIYLIREVKQ
ncbi:endonuclease/exonuclease/phosphatase family protein [Christiangramia sabulilitoris]|uniref:Endonuclease/exonuclease/phosphatase family protein n=1 Tax=Christiangramia sabulilitoris TaxID=2583991 RepID=A0A550I9D2_9FLAO|nr:endonuclease/exonuclease/phosphatase family protein [Christiangramia sabulilitoris]